MVNTSIKDQLPAPWGKVQEYARNGRLDDGTYIRIIIDNERTIKYGLAYSKIDESMAIHRASKEGYLILVRMVDKGRVSYAIINGVTNELWSVSEKEACDMAFKCIRELVDRRLI